MELTARVRAALRDRAGSARFELEELSIDYDSRRVTVSGRPVKLTATEYDVLRVLSVNAGRVSTYRSLLRQAWSKHDGTVKPKLVHAVVQTLRRKLGEGRVPRGLDPERARARLPHARTVTASRAGANCPAVGTPPREKPNRARQAQTGALIDHRKNLAIMGGLLIVVPWAR